ncbi:MAG TPA: hypothetical protein EYH15_03670 [Methanothermococcus okinawensis]|uniref:Uncharacterized protein n=1 Tax=Methanothermococcus okinawensis TaxID=155863 RepID=A0A833E3P9_9EURY|nr:hypothetical protein [Methanococcaceae archaeon]HIP84565.1 hypothetical protein [Methanothermococcus okinawensis]HIP90815.1 hypothetical protein [Methanothermococcus okinawensis]
MEEIDVLAVGLLLTAPMMSDYEMRCILSKLKKIAKKKKMTKYKNINEILDEWANRAYQLSMKY